MKYQNPQCDGIGPCAHGETRLMLTGKTRMDGGVILCRCCWAHELEYRRERNRFLSPDCKFQIPTFEDSTP